MSENIFKGEFSVKDGKLDFSCTTKDKTFEEVEQGLIMLKIEIERQLENKNKCPYYPNPKLIP